MDLRTRALKLCLLAFSCAASAPSQEPATPSPAPVQAPVEEQAPGTIQGSVLSGATGQALRRAQVLLRPADSKASQPDQSALYQTTDESGTFVFPKVAPGRYVITVQRDGYLPLSAGRIGDYKMPPVFTMNSGQTISSFVWRMTPSAVVSGKVKFDDAEPAVNVAVQLYRSYYDRGRHGYAVAATAHTDDRGEYRVHGLEPGSYYVAALYQAPSRPTSAQQELRKDALGNPLPELGYAVTFFPQAQRMSDAVPIKIVPGDEVGGIDIFLTLVHTVHIRGRVITGLKGGVIASPNVTVRMNDADNTASVTAPIDVVVDKDQNFDIGGVTAGPYFLIATAEQDGMPLTGRVPINIGDADVPSADILVNPQTVWTGKVHLDDDDSAVPSGLMIAIEPRRSTAAAARANVAENGEFSIPFVPDETYDLYVLNAPEDSYLKSVRLANSERLGEGLEASAGAAPPPLDVRLSSQGGQIVGRAVTADPKVVASGATVVLIPNPPSGRVQAYQTTHADEYGNFMLRGIAPGTYLVVAWLDTAPCNVYDPDDLAACRSQGSSVTVDAAEQQNVQLTAN